MLLNQVLWEFDVTHAQGASNVWPAHDDGPHFHDMRLMLTDSDGDVFILIQGKGKPFAVQASDEQKTVQI
jgi:hypothetical protein